MSQLPTLGGSNGAVSAINNSGAIAGLAQTPAVDTSCPAPLLHDYKPVVWGPGSGQIRELRPLPGDTVGVAFWINDRGQVVGTSDRAQIRYPGRRDCRAARRALGFRRHAYRSRKSRRVSRYHKDGVGNRAIYINNSGQVVGGSTLAGNKTAHAFLWTSGSGMKDLGVVAGLQRRPSFAINSAGDQWSVERHAGRPSCVHLAQRVDDRSECARSGRFSSLSAVLRPGSTIGEIVGFGATEGGDVHILATPDNSVRLSKAMGMTRSEDQAQSIRRKLLRSRSRAPLK